MKWHSLREITFCVDRVRPKMLESKNFDSKYKIFQACIYASRVQTTLVSLMSQTPYISLLIIIGK